MTETAQEYKARIIGGVAGQEPLRVLAATKAKLNRLVRGASASRLGRRPAPGKWSVREIMTHLADTELVLGTRLRFVLGEPGVAIIGFDQDKWITALHYEKRTFKDAFAAWSALREFNLKLLRTLTPAQWQVAGMHSERGRETVREMVTMMAGHDVNHLQQIARIVGKNL